MRAISALRALMREALKSRAMKAWFFASAALLAGVWLLYLWKLLPFVGRAEPLVIHYSVLVGIDKIAPWYWTLLPPLLASAALALNMLLSLLFWRRGRREIALLIGIFTVFLLILFLIATLFLALLNAGV